MFHSPGTVSARRCAAPPTTWDTMADRPALRAARHALRHVPIASGAPHGPRRIAHAPSSTSSDHTPSSSSRDLARAPSRKRPYTPGPPESSPTPACAPSPKRPRPRVRTVSPPARVCAPHAPVPRRRLQLPYTTDGPRTPSSSSPFRGAVRSRLHGHTPPRTPGGMWDIHMRATHALSPPSILVSPPAADIESILAHTRQDGHALHRLPIRHEWQFAFVGTLLARDQAALAKLQWQLDLAFAALACPPAHASILEHRPRLATRLAQQTAHAVVHLLRRAWKPSTPAEFAYSPPSFRESSATREPLAPGALGAMHTAWAQHLSGVLGAEMVDKIAAHITQALWYMATQYVAALIPGTDSVRLRDRRPSRTFAPHASHSSISGTTKRPAKVRASCLIGAPPTPRAPRQSQRRRRCATHWKTSFVRDSMRRALRLPGLHAPPTRSKCPRRVRSVGAHTPRNPNARRCATRRWSMRHASWVSCAASR